jgi:hypothetical protein
LRSCVARQRPALQLEQAAARQQRRFRLQQVRAVDREQDVAFLDDVADVGEGLHDLPGILREYLHRHVLVEVDGADRGLDRLEAVQLRRCYLDRIELLAGQFDKLDVSGCRSRRTGFALRGFLGRLACRAEQRACAEQRRAGRDAEHNESNFRRPSFRKDNPSSHDEHPKAQFQFANLPTLESTRKSWLRRSLRLTPQPYAELTITIRADEIAALSQSISLERVESS